ncbi:MAG: hypothetical protein ACI9G5_000538 [Paracoccaceae bacterium]|jgi:hypothetical protein
MSSTVVSDHGPTNAAWNCLTNGERTGQSNVQKYRLRVRVCNQLGGEAAAHGGSLCFPFHLRCRTAPEFRADLGDDVVVGLGLQSSFSPC